MCIYVYYILYNTQVHIFHFYDAENRHQCDVNNGGCSDMCETADSGLGYCMCSTGYRVTKNGGCKGIYTQPHVATYIALSKPPLVFKDTLHCDVPSIHTDINECNTDTHGCEQNCRDLEGSFHCYCNEGYALGLGGKVCNSMSDAV